MKRSAIVGCGGIAQVHARALSSMAEAELAAFADIKYDRAQAMASSYGGRAYSSLEDMLDSEPVDVLHICTPHYLHLPMAQEAARRGIAVFTEKPPVMNRAQWAALQSISVPIGVCFQNRYNGSTRACKALLATGRPGRILGSRGIVTWRREAPYYTESGWRGALATEGGGALMNQAVHTLDLMSYFLGEGTVLGASLANRHLRGVIEVEDTIEAALDFSGARGLFYATTAYCADSPVIFELECENATLRLEGERFTRFWHGGSVEQDDYTSASTAPGKAYWGSSHQRCIEDFYLSLKTGAPFQNSVPEVKNTVELLLSLYETARAH